MILLLPHIYKLYLCLQANMNICLKKKSIKTQETFGISQHFQQLTNQTKHKGICVKHNQTLFVVS